MTAQPEQARTNEQALAKARALDDPTMTAWLMSHVTGMHWGCGVSEDEDACFVARLAAQAAAPEQDEAVRLRELLAELISSARDAGMNASSPFGYMPSTQQADERVISDITSEIVALASPPPAPVALDVERLAEALIVEEPSDPDWMILFNWHRAEDDPDKARSAAEVIIRRLTRQQEDS